MILNDMNTKVERKFFKEVAVEDNGEEIVYVFPDTKEFISIIRRDMNKKLILKE